MNTQPSPQRPPQPDGQENIEVRHKFTKDERSEMSDRQNVALTRVGELEAQLAAATTSFQAQIQAEMGKMRELGNKLNAGHEMRPVCATVEYNPTAGIKRYYADKAKKTLIKEAPMKGKDYELELPLAVATAVALDPVSSPGLVAITVAPSAPVVEPSAPPPALVAAEAPAPQPAPPVELPQATPAVEPERTLGERVGLLTDALAVIHSEGKANAALIMRRLRISYACAFGLLETLEKNEHIGPMGAGGQWPVLALPELSTQSAA